MDAPCREQHTHWIPGKAKAGLCLQTKPCTSDAVYVHTVRLPVRPALCFPQHIERMGSRRAGFLKFLPHCYAAMQEWRLAADAVVHTSAAPCQVNLTGMMLPQKLAKHPVVELQGSSGLRTRQCPLQTRHNSGNNSIAGGLAEMLLTLKLSNSTCRVPT